jgi:hypothetical protein
MISLNYLWSVHLVSWLPCVVSVGISGSFDKVLELSSPAMTSVASYLLYLIFRFSVDKVRWWTQVVRSVHSCFMIGR